MGALSRIRGLLTKSTAEGQPSPGPYWLGDGWLPAGTPLNFWQMGQNVRPYTEASAMVEACVGAYAQTIAMCPGDHWLTLDTGGRRRVTSSALTRWLRRPNDYQSISDFLLNLVRSLYTDGNGYALALRNDRGEIAEMHPMMYGWPRVAETGEVFYELSGNEVVERRFGSTLMVPARDVLHVRLHTPRHPLRGVSPIVAVALDLAASSAMTRQQAAFFENQARPSIILESDERWTAEQTREIRRRWDEMTRGANAGGTPILGHGIKAKTLGGTAQDAQLAETLKMADEHIALAYRLPMQVLGISSGGTTMGSTESLMSMWLASGLGFALNHIEEAIGNLFRLRGQPEEYLEFNTRVLLRSSFKERMEGLVRGVQGGIFTINEARNLEDNPDAVGGDEPRVQQQMVPLSYGAAMQPPQPAPQSPEPANDAGNDDDATTKRGTDDIYRKINGFSIH